MLESVSLWAGCQKYCMILDDGGLVGFIPCQKSCLVKNHSGDDVLVSWLALVLSAKKSGDGQQRESD